MARDDLTNHLRSGPSEAGPGQVLLRGSPLTSENFVRHAARTARAYDYDGTPCFGISAELASSEAEIERLLRGRRLSTRRTVSRLLVDEVLAQGFLVLPTFSAPHVTVVLDRAPLATAEALLALALRAAVINPYHRTGREE